MAEWNKQKIVVSKKKRNFDFLKGLQFPIHLTHKKYSVSTKKECWAGKAGFEYGAKKIYI